MHLLEMTPPSRQSSDGSGCFMEVRDNPGQAEDVAVTKVQTDYYVVDTIPDTDLLGSLNSPSLEGGEGVDAEELEDMYACADDISTTPIPQLFDEMFGNSSTSPRDTDGYLVDTRALAIQSTLSLLDDTHSLFPSPLDDARSETIPDESSAASAATYIHKEHVVDEPQVSYAEFCNAAEPLCIATQPLGPNSKTKFPEWTSRQLQEAAVFLTNMGLDEMVTSETNQTILDRWQRHRPGVFIQPVAFDVTSMFIRHAVDYIYVLSMEGILNGVGLEQRLRNDCQSHEITYEPIGVRFSHDNCPMFMHAVTAKHSSDPIPMGSKQ